MKKNYGVLIILGIITLAVGTIAWHSKYNFVPQMLYKTFSAKGEEFPDIDQRGLSEIQQKVIAVAKEEHAKKPDYTKYSEENKEPWCADFVSWVYRAAGVPFSNPHSGSWRIPGTLTLREYLDGENRLKTPESNYSPKPGDLMLFNNPSSFGQHVNIVLKVNDDGTITSVGGNEPGGIRVKTHFAHQERGFVGYGTLTSSD